MVAINTTPLQDLFEVVVALNCPIQTFPIISPFLWVVLQGKMNFGSPSLKDVEEISQLECKNIFLLAVVLSLSKQSFPISQSISIPLQNTKRNSKRTRNIAKTIPFDW